MNFLKKLWHFIISSICAPTRPVASFHVNHSVSTSVDVRLIHCLSKNTPAAYSGHVRPKFHVGVISSEFPKKCMIPEHSASFVNMYDSSLPDFPELVSIPGFEHTMFYPFKELAQSLGYDILWCTFKEPGSKDYTGHVLFTEHVAHGVWIHIKKKSAEKYLGNVYHDELYTGGWAYASRFKNSDKYCYIVQMVGNSVCVPLEDILRIVEP